MGERLSTTDNQIMICEGQKLVKKTCEMLVKKYCVVCHIRGEVESFMHKPLCFKLSFTMGSFRIKGSSNRAITNPNWAHSVIRLISIKIAWI